MNNKNIKNKFKIIFKSSFFILILFLLVLSIAYIPNSKTIVKAVNINPKSWNSDLYEITGIENEPQYKYISIKDLVKLDSNGLVTEVCDPTTIVDNTNTVIMLSDGLDIYYFSEACNPLLTKLDVNKLPLKNNYYDKFLGFNYILGADIDYEDASKTFQMMRPIGWGDNNGVGNNHTFYGHFDGRGHTIKNLFFKSIEDENDYNTYYTNKKEAMAYIAWFSNNSGTIKNLGIINPNMIQYYYSPNTPVISTLVGINTGIIENCFIQDLRGNNAGISAEGGYTISMFASINEKGATIKNSYVASDRISSTSVQMTSQDKRYPFINENRGTITNCYYDYSILNKNNNTYNNINDNIITKLTTVDFLDKTKFNYNSNVWFSNSTYDSKLTPYIGLKYPVLKGLRTNPENTHFLINNATELVYMSELIDRYPIFGSKKYLITKSIDLNSVKDGSFVFSNKPFSGVLEGKLQDPTTPENKLTKVILANNKTSSYPAILNLNIKKGHPYNGYHCYGMFGILSGTVRNLDFYNTKITQEDITKPNYTEINSIGSVCGILEGGTIENVNVKTNIMVTNKPNAINTQVHDYLGKENIGGICGTTFSGTITKCTTTGLIDTFTYKKVNQNYENNIGGIIGRINNIDSLLNCLNNITIEIPTYKFTTQNTYRQYIGGVIGSGSIKNTLELHNNAPIKMSSEDYALIPYIGGVIGRIENSEGINGKFLNNGNIEFVVNDLNTKAYISGVMNIISEVANINDTFNVSASASDIQTKIDSLLPFEFSSITNAGTLKITNKLTKQFYPLKYQVFDNSIKAGLDIRTAGISYSYLTNYNINGAYNLKDYYKRETDGLFKKYPNNPQIIDVSIIDEFGPTFNADNKAIIESNKLHIDNNILLSKSTLFKDKQVVDFIYSKINLQKVYNERSINYISTQDINSYMMQLSGCINGVNFNLTNVHNTGDIKVYITNNTNTTITTNQTYSNYFGDSKKLKIFGIMEEVSVGFSCKDLYNGGNITISTLSNTCDFNIYASGLCYKNIGNDPSINQKLMIEKGYVGSLHNSINNGDIRITNGDIINSNNINVASITGQCSLSGIASINSSTISSCLNLGNIYSTNNVTNNSSVDAAGFAAIMQNEELKIKDPITTTNIITRANIVDSANNGKIIALNTSTTIGTVNASGFVCRNDYGEDSLTVDDTSSINNNPHLQKIEYSINYGEVYAYNYNENYEEFTEQNSKSAGFVSSGALTIVDVVNYGNIFGSSLASGIFGSLCMDRMHLAGLNVNSKINIANSLNYGHIQNISDTVKSPELFQNKLINGEPLNDYFIEDTYTATKSSSRVAGAFIGMITKIDTLETGNSVEILYTLNIKNLVNMSDKNNMLGGIDETALNFGESINILNDFMEYMATTKTKDESPIPFKTDELGRYGIKCYYKDNSKPKDTENPFTQEHNGGIFNENYVLRNAPKNLGNNGDYENNTDYFIEDYIQFIPYSKVNDLLMNKIGIDDSGFKNAMELLQKDVSFIKVVLDKKYPQADINIVYEAIKNGDLNIDKNIIFKELKNELINHYNDTDVEDIYKLLLNSNNNFYNNSIDANVDADIDQIPAVTNKYIDQFLVSGQINTEFNNLLTDPNYIASLIKTNPGLFSDNYIVPNINYSNYEQQFADMFGYLIASNSSYNNFNRNITKQKRDEISNELYPLFKNNQVVKDKLVQNYYTQINYNIKDLKTFVFDSKNGVTKEEYINMYNTLKASNTNIDDVNKAIDGLAYEDLKVFVKNLDSEIRTNDILETFIDSGRKATTGIYLPASKGAYIESINKNNYTLANNETGLIYSGNKSDINGNLMDTSLKEIYVYKDAYFIQKRTAQSYTLSGNNSYIIQEKAPKNNYVVFYFGQLDDPKIQYKKDNDSKLNIINDKHTGIYATYDNGNFKDIKLAQYIDYGKFTDKNVTRKSSGNINFNMMVSMTRELNKNKNSETTIKTYLKNIYKEGINSKKNGAFFVKILLDITSPNEQYNLQELQENIKNTNKYIILNNLNFDSKVKLVDYFIPKTYKNYSKILKLLFQQIDTVSNPSPNIDLIKKYLPNFFKYGASYLSNNKNFKELLQGYIKNLSLSETDQKEIIKLTPAIYKTYFKKDIESNNSIVSAADRRILMYGLLLDDLNTIKTYANLKDSTKSILSAYIISNNKKLFDTYISKAKTMEELKKQLAEYRIDPTLVTDFTGIYALASSYGINDGLFIPDNVKLTDIDSYLSINENGESIRDSSWRGGTETNPNDVTNKNSVNYKVFNEMKQLKKSIATRVFEIELIGANKPINQTDEIIYDTNNIVRNNREDDYIFDVKKNHFEVNFYIPINHSIINNDSLLINMDLGHYELSYGATFDSSKTFEIQLKGKTLKAGDELTDTFIIQAEDTTVKTTFNLKVHFIENSYLDNPTLNINGSTSSINRLNRTVNNTNVVDIQAVDKVKYNQGQNGSINIVYNTINMANGLSFIDNINVYNTSLTSLTQIDATTYTKITDKLVKDTDYFIPIENNNGIVVIPNVTDSGLDTKTNTYKPGTLSIEVQINNLLKSGIYAIELTYSNDIKYYTFFEKAQSDLAYVEKLTYNGQEFIAGPDVLNNETTSIHKYGLPLTEANLKQVINGKPAYLDEFVIAPLATFEITNVTVREVGNKKLYNVFYSITSEDKTQTIEFTHHITEYDVDTNIYKVFKDGFILKDGPISTGFTAQFEKQENPSYRFEYDLSKFNIDVNKFSVKICDSKGVEITDINELNQINNSITINVIDEIGFEVIFSELALATDYYFKLVYNNEVKFKETDPTPLKWNIEFNLVKLTKLKNRRSYIDNISFNSDTVIASTRTVISTKNMTYDEYDKMSKDSIREIASLPGKIHYNKYEIVYNETEVIKQSDFYTIGLVNKTMLDFYSPTFTLPDGAKIYRSKQINGTVYNYVPYFNSTNKEVVFMVSEDKTKFKNDLEEDIIVTGNVNEFTYSGETYKISPAAGLIEVEVNGKIIQNNSLLTNYTENGTYKEEINGFSYIDYRVYAEMYENDPNNNYYVTTYHIATLDATNNVKLNVVIDIEEGCDIYTKSYDVFFEFSCFRLKKGGVENTSVQTKDYEYYNKAGLFAYFNRSTTGLNTNVLTHEELQTNTAGWYHIKSFLPKGYTFTYTFSEGKELPNTPTTHLLVKSEADAFCIESSIFAKTYTVHITIKNGVFGEDPWGVKEEINSMDIIPTNQAN